MVSHNDVLLAALACVTIIEVVALLKGIDGVVLASSLGAVCAIAGVKWQQTRASGFYPREGLTGRSAVLEPKLARGCRPFPAPALAMHGQRPAARRR